MRNRNVLISGAGPAGMTLAYWLRRHGFSPTVVERASAPRDGGQAVDVRGAAIEVARRTGILDELRRARTGTRGMSYVNSTGKWLASMNAAFGVIDPADVEIVRGDLVRIMHQAIRDDVEYIFADSITGICENADGVEVTFRAGAIARVRPGSGCRRVALERARARLRPRIRFIHYLGLYLAIFTIPNDLGLDHWQLIHAVPGKSVTITAVRENTEARAIFFFASPPLDYDHHDTRQQQDILADAFSAEQWEVSRLLKAMRNAPDFYFDSASQIRMDNWSAGRVTLLGDAGYCPSPLSGQGTSLALVGAYVLAGELQAAVGDHQAACARYQQQMNGFVEQNQQIALGNAKRFTPGTRTQIWLQNQTIKALPYMPWKSHILNLATKGRPRGRQRHHPQMRCRVR